GRFSDAARERAVAARVAAAVHAGGRAGRHGLPRPCRAHARGPRRIGARLARGPARRCRPCRPFPRQRLLHRRAALRSHRLLLRLHGRFRLRPRHLPQRLVFRGGRLVQPDEGPGDAHGLRARAPARGRRGGGASRPLPGRGPALHADAARRLAKRAPGRAGEAEGPARIRPQALLPPPRRERGRIRPCPMTRDSVTIYTDGACSGNPGPGGWGVLLVYQGKEKELSGGEPETTNNRMELTAAIMALEALKRPCAVDLFTDSQYVRHGITQ